MNNVPAGKQSVWGKGISDRLVGCEKWEYSCTRLMNYRGKTEEIRRNGFRTRSMTEIKYLIWVLNGEWKTLEEKTDYLSQISSISIEDDNTRPIERDWSQECWRDNLSSQAAAQVPAYEPNWKPASSLGVLRKHPDKILSQLVEVN